MPKRIEGDFCSVPDCGRLRSRKSNGMRRSKCPGHTSRIRHRSDLSQDVPIKEYVRTADGGHLSSYGYWLERAPGHPLANSNGEVLQHRLRLYGSIGAGVHPCHWCEKPVDWATPFPLGLVVDHVDGNRLNNDRSNLVPACQPCNAARASAGNPIVWAPAHATD